MNAPSARLVALGRIAREAGQAILDVYHGDFAVSTKTDDSPLTAADLAAQRVIQQRLAELDPALPMISEEARATPWAERRTWPRYWLIDPLDGTREFVKRNGEFTVNIALIEDHASVLGVVLAPVTGALHVAARGAGSWLQETADGPWRRLHTRTLANPAVVVGSRSHGSGAGARLDALVGPGHVLKPLGSSLKFCLSLHHCRSKMRHIGLLVPCYGGI